MEARKERVPYAGKYRIIFLLIFNELFLRFL